MNASTSPCGRRRTNPTVSVSSTGSPPGQREPAGRRVERREQPVLDEHAGVGEAVEQRRLAGVRVADDRDGGETAAAAALALELARVLQLLELVLELGDAALDPPPVDLELGLAAAEAGADAAALLREVGARAAAQPRQPVAQERQLDLGLALERVGVLGEDVEDHRGAVERGAPEQLLEVELLRRASSLSNTTVSASTARQSSLQLLDLALAEVERASRELAALLQPGDLVGTGGVDQQRELVEAGLGVVVGVRRQRHPDEHDLLSRRCAR